MTKPAFELAIRDDPRQVDLFDRRGRISAREKIVEFRFHLPFFNLSNLLLSAAGAGIPFFATAFAILLNNAKITCEVDPRRVNAPPAS